MSNVIKSYTIRYEPTQKKTIDYKDRDEELLVKRNSKLSLPQEEEGFKEGLQAAVVETTIDDKEEKKRASITIEKAQKEAEAILVAAKAEAKRLEQKAIEEGKKLGYEEGIANSNAEIQQMKNNIIKQEEIQKEEYKKIIAGIEGQVAELLMSLITKITGIIIEDKADVILYLIENALLNNDKADSYTIFVSKEDYDFLMNKKEYIEGIIDQKIQITIDAQLGKNQCLIETERKVINCSLDAQINNLITDLKLLSGV